MPDTGFPLKIECDKMLEYQPVDAAYDEDMSMNDVFTPFCPTIRGCADPGEILSVGQRLTCRVMGAHVQHGVLVDLGERNRTTSDTQKRVLTHSRLRSLHSFLDLGANVAGLIPMYHDPGKTIDSQCFESLGMEKFAEIFGEDKEVTVVVHSLKLDKYPSSPAYVYRFPVEGELVDPPLSDSVLAKPLDPEESKKISTIFIKNASDDALWQAAWAVTGRKVFPLSKLDEYVEEYERTREEQISNIADAEIFDPNHDDFGKKRGAPDPLWGLDL